jgi:hypothetical protein
MPKHDLYVVEFPIFELYSRKIGDKISVNSRTISKCSMQSRLNCSFICHLKHIRGLSSKTSKGLRTVPTSGGLCKILELRYK